MKLLKDVNSDSDYVVQGLLDGDSLWLEVGKFSIAIKQNDIGISVDVYPLNSEDADPIAELVAYEEDNDD